MTSSYSSLTNVLLQETIKAPLEPQLKAQLFVAQTPSKSLNRFQLPLKVPNLFWFISQPFSRPWLLMKLNLLNLPAQFCSKVRLDWLKVGSTRASLQWVTALEISSDNTTHNLPLKFSNNQARPTRWSRASLKQISSKKLSLTANKWTTGLTSLKFWELLCQTTLRRQLVSQKW